MAKTYKAIQFTERVCSCKYKSDTRLSNVPKTLYHVETSVLDEKTDRIVKRSSFKPKPSLKHLKVSDFCMENLQAVGVPLSQVILQHDMQTNISMIEQSALQMDKSFTNQLNK